MILTDILLGFIIVELAIIAVFLSPSYGMDGDMMSDMLGMVKEQMAVNKAARLKAKKKGTIRSKSR
jgi:hypothetical protein